MTDNKNMSQETTKKEAPVSKPASTPDPTFVAWIEEADKDAGK